MRKEMIFLTRILPMLVKICSKLTGKVKKKKKPLTGVAFVFFNDSEQTFANTFYPKFLHIAKANDTTQYINNYWRTSQWRFNIVIKYQNLSFTCLIPDFHQDFVLKVKLSPECFTTLRKNEPISTNIPFLYSPKNVRKPLVFWRFHGV